MRLKTLRKESIPLETEGAVLHGNRINLSANDLRHASARCHTSPSLSTSFNTDLPSRMSSASRDLHDTSLSSMHNPSAYRAIEAAYRRHGIRIRLDSGRSIDSRPSTALHRERTILEPDYDSPTLNTLPYTSSTGFNPDHVQHAPFAQLLRDTNSTDDAHPALLDISSPSPVPDKSPKTHRPAASFEHDPDFLYMTSLLRTSTLHSFKDTIRRRAGLRAIFSAHRHPVSSTVSRENSFSMNRTAATRHSPVRSTDITSPRKLDKDIVKHAARIRASQAKDFLSTPNASTVKSDLRKRNSMHTPSKPISLKPLELLLSTASVAPSDHSPSKSRSPKRPPKRSMSARIPLRENQKLIHGSSLRGDESNLLSQNLPRHSNSFDSGCYERSSSGGGDTNSVTSSNIAPATSSRPVRLQSPKKVSFFEQPIAIAFSPATSV